MKLGGLARKDDPVVRDFFQKAFNEVRLYPAKQCERSGHFFVLAFPYKFREHPLS